MLVHPKIVVVALIGFVLLATGYTADGSGQAAGPTAPSAATTTSAATGTSAATPTSPGAAASTTAPAAVAAPSSPAATAVPGAAALTPAPADPGAAKDLRTVSALPGGTLSGHLALTVSGLVGFDDDVWGTCTSTADSTVLTASLPDGSVDTTSFTSTGSTTTLVAPDGTTSANTLQEITITVTGDTLALTAAMVRTGTSEPSGQVDLTATCS